MWHVLKRSPEKRSRLGGRRVVPEGDDEDEVQDVRAGSERYVDSFWIRCRS